MMKCNKRKYLLFGIVFCLLIGVGITYRYSSKRIQYYGHYNKIWAHRVNTIKKLKSAQNKFEGVELDLYYDDAKNQLFVSHAANPLVLNFSDYLKAIENRDLHLWLDMKNLTPKNDRLILAVLEQEFKNTAYQNHKKHILVEAQFIKALPVFEDAGYRTSFYITAITNQMETEQRDSLTKSLKLALKSQPKLELSGNYKNYNYLKKNFPQTTKNLWTLMSTYDKRIFTEYSQIREMMKDTTVKTFLSSYVNFNRYF